MLSRGDVQAKDGDRAMLDMAVQAYFARQRGEVVEEVVLQVKPRPAGRVLTITRPKKSEPIKAEGPNGPRRKRDQLAPKVRELAAQLLSIRSISQQLGITSVTLRKIASENSIELRGPTSRQQHTLDMIQGRQRRSRDAQARRDACAPKVRELAAQGKTAGVIADEMNHSKRWVERVARENNITITAPDAHKGNA